MKINLYTPYTGGVLTVDLRQHDSSVPDTIDFEFNHGNVVNVNFWLIQCLRRETMSTDEGSGKLDFIKSIRLSYSMGLKEAKDIAEWFLANVAREVCGKL